MPRIFNTIRQRLLKENRLTRYLVYAIGEILLVVIGILIALQVNEWNNARNRDKAEAVIISQLKTDLETSAKELEEIKAFYLERVQACAEVTRAFYKVTVPHDSIERALGIARSARMYSPILGTARSLVNSGRIDLLSATELKSDVISYVEKVDYILKDISRYEETYYRTGGAMAHEVMPNTFRSLAYMDSLAKDLEANSESYRASVELGMNTYPAQIERLPFRSDLGELFQNEKLFSAYVRLHTAHRNLHRRYGEILDLTTELLEKIDP